MKPIIDDPLGIDLFCGLGGWTEGLLDQGYRVVGFDIEVRPYPAQLVLQDVLTIHGSQFKDAALIVASPPCQAYSYMAMPFSNGKKRAAEYRDGTRSMDELNACFNACFRIQREASEAAGHHIPMVVENVKGAAPWVGRAKWHYGSFYLYGDVPALMPFTRSLKVGRNFHQFAKTGVPSPSFHGAAHEMSVQRCEEIQHGVKNNNGGSWFAVSHNATSSGVNPVNDGVKQPGQKNGEEYRLTQSGRKTAGLKQQRDGPGHTRHLTNQREHDAVKQPGLSGEKWFNEGAASVSSASATRKQAFRRDRQDTVSIGSAHRARVQAIKSPRPKPGASDQR